MADGLSLATKDSEGKELHFATPLSLSGSRRSSLGHQPPPIVPPEGKRLKVKGRGKGKGKGKGKGEEAAGSGGVGLVSKTPDGRLVSYAYNNEGCTKPECSMLHGCRVKGCQKGHPMNEHTAA